MFRKGCERVGKENEDAFWDIEDLLPDGRPKKTVRGGAVRNDTEAQDVEIGAEPGMRGEPIPPRAQHPTPTAVASCAMEYVPEGGFLELVEICEWPSVFGFYSKFRRDALRFFAKHGAPCEYVYFFAYMPQYDQMTAPQLRYYLYWRDCVKKGIYQKTDINYIFLYVYEIINLPDRVSPQKGVMLLFNLWKAYRESFPYLDKYLGEWFCDYCLIHRVSPPWEDLSEFAGEVAGKVSLPEFYLRNNTLSWSVIEGLSAYDYRASKFYEANRLLYDRHIPLAAERVAQKCVVPRFSEYGVESVRVLRDSFTGAVACREVKYKIAVHCMPLRRSPELKKALTGIVKLCENALRAALEIKSRFAPSGVTAEMRDEVNAYFDEFFPRAAKKKKKIDEEEAYMALYEPENRGPADIGRALEIEASAWEVTEILGEDAEEPGDASVIAQTSPEKVPAVSVTAASDERETPAPAEDEDDFAFIVRMDGFLREALLAAARGAMDAFCRENGKLAHTVCAEINEIAMEAFGDMIVSEDDFSLISDYADEIREALALD